MEIQSILIANRGEIAIRVIRACRELGIRSIAVYSEADQQARHTLLADLAVPIGPAPAQSSYLNRERIIAAAQHSGADAIHPGYGFLSENAAFAEACAKAGIIFIGPPPAAMRLMGSKTAAKEAVMRGDVPTVPGFIPLPRVAGKKHNDTSDANLLARAAEKIGYPVLIKAAAGGGGRGMRAVHAPGDFMEALAAAQREAEAAFGDPAVFLEKLVVSPRHIEFQILADAHGHCVYLGERECSIQRRHQKIVEEAPAVVLTPTLRAQMGEAAVRAAQSAGYINAGTVEFLLDRSGNFYFLEMNTRLQVEHPVTEQVMGVDLVREQIAIAEGRPLPWTQAEIGPRGHAIEVRVYAEDPVTYLPATGTLLAYEPPQGPGIRLDDGVVTGDLVSVYYDPLLAKLIVSAPDRPAAIARLQAALADYAILGVTTNLPLLRQISADARFAHGETFTDFLEDSAYQPPEISPVEPPPAAHHPLALVVAALRQRTALRTTSGKRSPWEPGALRSGTFATRLTIGKTEYQVELREMANPPASFQAIIDGVPVALDASVAGQPLTAVLAPGQAGVALRQGVVQQRWWAAARPDGAILVTDGTATLVAEPMRPPDIDAVAHSGGAGTGGGAITAPMAGTIIQVRVQPGEVVQPRQTLVVLGAMKMEHNLIATEAGRVRRVNCQEGDVVAGGKVLVELEPADTEK